jgi:hypothetical protein
MGDVTQHTLELKLSGKGQVVYPKSAEEFSKNYPRCSEWNTKLPATVVKVASEKDIIETVICLPISLSGQITLLPKAIRLRSQCPRLVLSPLDAEINHATTSDSNAGQICC